MTDYDVLNAEAAGRPATALPVSLDSGQPGDHAVFLNMNRVTLRASARNASSHRVASPEMVVTVEGSDDGVSWATVKTFTLTASSPEQSATVDCSNARLRVTWLVVSGTWSVPSVTAVGFGGSSSVSVPIADAVGVVVNTTTYDDSIKGSGKLTTLVFPADQTAIAIALDGDAFPRWILGADPTDYGLLASDGTFDPVGTGNFMAYGAGHWDMGAISLGINPTQSALAARIRDLSPRFTITSGALPTVQLVSGAGVQIDTTRDSEVVTPVTFNPTAGAAATCKLELSPDDVTYSSLGVETEPPGIALDGTIHLVKVRVPAGWYVKATVVNAVLGVSTHY